MARTRVLLGSAPGLGVVSETLGEQLNERIGHVEALGDLLPGVPALAGKDGRRAQSQTGPVIIWR